MLYLVEDNRVKEKVLKIFTENLRLTWTRREQRWLVWRPDKKYLWISHNRKFWFTSIKLPNTTETPRYWNSFGVYQANSNLQIVVEINIPIQSNTKRVSGFLAVDRVSGEYYLMHDGSVGGGRQGVSRENFLKWSGAKLIPVEDSSGRIRLGIIVTPITRNMGNKVSRFVQMACDFKQAIKNHDIDTPSTDSGLQYRDYFREFSGRKKGRRAREFEYITRHGDIVDALFKWSKKKGTGRPTKSVLIDLGIENPAGKLMEIYEVKTNSERQTLYTAIGQIMVHSAENKQGIRKFLVLPKASRIPHDIKATIKRLKIIVLNFEIKNDRIIILVNKATLR